MHRLLERASVLGLAALALMAWSVLDARPTPIVLAMTLGQAIGTASVVVFLVAVGRDLQARWKDFKSPDVELR